MVRADGSAFGCRRGLRPGTPQFRRLAAPRAAACRRPSPGRTARPDMAGCHARSVRSASSSAGCAGGPPASGTPSGSRRRLRRGGRPAFDGHLRPHELAWLLERREVVPPSVGPDALPPNADWNRPSPSGCSGTARSSWNRRSVSAPNASPTARHGCTATTHRPSSGRPATGCTRCTAFAFRRISSTGAGASSRSTPSPTARSAGSRSSGGLGDLPPGGRSPADGHGPGSR